MTTEQTAGARLWLSLALVATFALLAGCGDSAAEDCASCRNPDLLPACEQAAAQCDEVPSDQQQTCIDEALDLCA